MRRLLALLAVLVLVLAAAGCGGGEDESSAGGDSAATIAPANAAAYVSVNTDLDSDEWDELNALLENFPGKDKLTALLRDSLREEGVELDDVKAALGPTVELVALGFEDADADLVGLAQPGDEQKFRELMTQSDERMVLREIEGWTAFAESEAALDRFEQARGTDSLADRDAFEQLMGELPEQALAKLWLDTARASEALAGFRGGGGPLPALSGTPVALSAALEAEDDGARLVAHYLNEDVEFEGADYGDLAEEVPADAFAFVNTHGQDGRLKLTEQLRDIPQAGSALEEAERMLGVTLEDVSTLFNREIVLWVRPGAIIPEVTLVLEVENEDEARATVDKLVHAAGSLGGDLETRPRTVDGVPATQIDLGDFSILYATVDGRLVVTSQPTGIEALTGDKDSLVDEDRYKDSVEAAGVPDDENVVMWVDLQETFGLVETLAQLGDEPLPPDARANLEPLRAVVFSASSSFEEGSMRLFLHVR